MLTDESLVKWSKTTELLITQIEDDSSGTGDDENPGTVVKILHLAQPVNAEGSLPTRDGHPMKVKNNKVYVAADDWEKFKKEATETDDGIVYKGTMHLDVSRPRTRTNRNGQVEVTGQSKIWLCTVKFSRRRGTLQQNGIQQTNNFMNQLFAEGKVLDLTVETPTIQPPKKEDEGGAGDKGATVDPTVVANQQNPSKNNKGKTANATN